ncbi:ribonuclease HII [Castellaniella caeni]|uniref:ribonuclease HII n=1 Tax=Castellaniella caeni TaxID=266123 RepID=UPI000A6FCE1E|nr:ribonuclease HII [Castellaniella caeni]
MSATAMQADLFAPEPRVEWGGRSPTIRSSASTWVAGVDEAGRGPLAGPVFAAAVILDPAQPIAGLADSKKLGARTRERLADEIRQRSLAWAIAQVGVEQIDQLNILQATLLAMRQACLALPSPPTKILVDGNRLPAGLPCAAQAVVGGDALVAAISAASILAKTARDADCLRLHALYPHYAFDQHKGYGTALHLARLAEFGPCPAHRRSFAPVRRLLDGPARGIPA